MPSPILKPIASSIDSQGNTIAVFDPGRYLVAKFDPAGALVWQRQVFPPAPFSTSWRAQDPVIAPDGKVFVLFRTGGSQSEEYERVVLYALDRQGSPIWLRAELMSRSNSGNPYQLHFDPKGNLYFGGIGLDSFTIVPTIIKLDASTGATIWRVDLSAFGDGSSSYVQSSVLTRSGRLFVTGPFISGDSLISNIPSVFEINVETGAVLRSFPIGQAFESSIAPGTLTEFEGTLIVGYDEFSRLTGVGSYTLMRHSFDGTPLWNRPLQFHTDTLPRVYESVANADSVLWVTSRLSSDLPFGSVRAICFDPVRGIVKWQSLLQDPSVDSKDFMPTVSFALAANQDVIYQTNGFLRRLDRSTGFPKLTREFKSNNLKLSKGSSDVVQAIAYHLDSKSHYNSEIVSYSGPDGQQVMRTPITLDTVVTLTMIGSAVDDHSVVVGVQNLDASLTLARVGTERNVKWKSTIANLSIPGNSTNYPNQLFIADVARNRLYVRCNYYLEINRDAIIQVDLSTGREIARYTFPYNPGLPAFSGPGMKLLPDGGLVARYGSQIVHLSPTMVPIYEISVPTIRAQQITDAGWLVGYEDEPKNFISISPTGSILRSTAFSIGNTIHGAAISLNQSGDLVMLMGLVGMMKMVTVDTETGALLDNQTITLPGESAFARLPLTLIYAPDRTYISVEGVSNAGWRRIVRRNSSHQVIWEHRFGDGQPNPKIPTIIDTGDLQQIYLACVSVSEPVNYLAQRRWVVDSLDRVMGSITNVIDDVSPTSNFGFVRSNSNRIWMFKRQQVFEHTIPVVTFRQGN